MRITILYDNTTAVTGGKPDWGFACLVEGMGKTILFDTGTKSALLKENIELLQVDTGKIDLIVISHMHGDHTGGLEWVLSQKKGLTVFLPASAGEPYLAKVRQWGGNPVPVSASREICAGVFSTGALPADFNPAFTEQALVIVREKGVLVLTGCAHPGILAIARRAVDMKLGKPDIALGGFHLAQTADARVMEIIAALKELGVNRCGATHCTGEAAIGLFRKEFGREFIEMGVGRVIDIAR